MSTRHVLTVWWCAPSRHGILQPLNSPMCWEGVRGGGGGGEKGVGGGYHDSGRGWRTGEG